MSELKTGVELELWVVDDAGHLCGGQEIADAHERIEPEFIDPLIEVQTTPHDDEFELRRDLETTLRAGLRAADKHDKRLVPLGTPLTASDVEANCERGDLFETIYGPGVQSAKNCAGTHVHFEKRAVVDQLNLLTALDPALALLSSSPYYCGENGDYSSRARAYRSKCGPDFRKFCDLWPYADSVAEWQDRVDYVYDQFKGLAAERGVAPETVEQWFEPEDTVLTPVRLRECQPTVEWRAPDAALPSEVIDLAVDVGKLVSQTETKPLEYGSAGVKSSRIGLPKFSTLEDLTDKAICSGLESTAVTAYLRRMGFDPAKYQPTAPKIEDSKTISKPEAREVRLEQADRLRNDLKAIAV